MSHNPFNNEIDKRFRGSLVIVEKDDTLYTGTCRIIDYNRKGVLLTGGVEGGVKEYRNADGRERAIVHVDEYDTITTVDAGVEWVRLSPTVLDENPYNVRSYDDDDMNTYARTIRDRGGLFTFPTAVRHGEDSYHLIGGHKRTEAATRANLHTIPVRVVKVDEAMALQLFCDEHVPMTRGELEGSDDGHSGRRGWYSECEISLSIDAMLEDFPAGFLRTYPQLDYWMDELELATENDD